VSGLLDHEFKQISALAHRKWGLSIDVKKRVIVENRLQALRREHPVDSVDSLVRTIESGGSNPLELALFDVLSTNHTSFFREEEHFDILHKEILTPAKAGGKGLRLWSAGCSRGCEPYTLSILLREVLSHPKRRDDRILATDLSTGALSAARAGVYSNQEVANVSPERLRTYFRQVENRGVQSAQIVPELRDIISFNMLNLLDPWPMKGPFDSIMCRNVMIYFDTPTREALARRFVSLLRPGGLFFIGTSESLGGYDVDVEQLMVGAYRKPGGSR
jgi:chemotaxis protein methyltransferase CheR